MLKSNLLQILALLLLSVWIGYPEPEPFDFVCCPRYLTGKEIDEIENSFLNRLEKSQIITSAVQENVNR